jgi:hypothetical protein
MVNVILAGEARRYVDQPITHWGFQIELQDAGISTPDDSDYRLTLEIVARAQGPFVFYQSHLAVPFSPADRLLPRGAGPASGVSLKRSVDKRSARRGSVVYGAGLHLLFPQR